MMSVLRLSVLIGGLIIIVDLASTALAQRTVSVDDAAAIDQVDNLINYLLFSLLGVLVARDTGILWSGAIAGVLASLLDAIVVTAAAVLAPGPPPLDVLEFSFARNLVVGTVFAGLAGLVYTLAQRWSGGRRSR
jgi:hypothetical protein